MPLSGAPPVPGVLPAPRPTYMCPRRSCLVPPSLSAPFHPASPVSPSSSAPGLPRVLLQLGTLLALCLLHALLALCLPPSPRPACSVSPAEHPVSLSNSRQAGCAPVSLPDACPGSVLPGSPALLVAGPRHSIPGMKSLELRFCFDSKFTSCDAFSQVLPYG